MSNRAGMCTHQKSDKKPPGQKAANDCGTVDKKPWLWAPGQKSVSDFADPEKKATHLSTVWITFPGIDYDFTYKG